MSSLLDESVQKQSSLLEDELNEVQPDMQAKIEAIE